MEQWRKVKAKTLPDLVDFPFHIFRSSQSTRARLVAREIVERVKWEEKLIVFDKQGGEILIFCFPFNFDSDILFSQLILPNLFYLDFFFHSFVVPPTPEIIKQVPFVAKFSSGLTRIIIIVG